MPKYAVETRSTEPKNFFAGDFPIVPETGTAGAAIAEHTPIAFDDDGAIVPITTETVSKVIGISAEAAAKDDPVVYYMTGEYFADAVNIPAGVDGAELKTALRKLSIFLK